MRAFADGVTAAYPGLDGIVANAGVMAINSARTADGFEMQFGANHLGHFLLVNRLAPLLKARAPSRLVVLSSGAHRLHNVDLEDPNFLRKPYDRWDAYGQSKTANAQFALAFDHRHRDDGVRAFTVAPGIITDTNLHHHLTQEDFAPLRLRQPGVVDLPRKHLAAGAATIVWALVHPELDGQGGRFLEDCGFSEVNPDPRLPNGVMPWALDQSMPRKSGRSRSGWSARVFARRRHSAQHASTAAPPSSAAVASGLSVNRQASTDRLRGKELMITLEGNGVAALDFLHDGSLRWRGLPGFALDQERSLRRRRGRGRAGCASHCRDAAGAGPRNDGHRARPAYASRAVHRLPPCRGRAALRAQDPGIATLHPGPSRRLAELIAAPAADADARSQRHARDLSLQRGHRLRAHLSQYPAGTRISA